MPVKIKVQAVNQRLNRTNETRRFFEQRTQSLKIVGKSF